MKISLTRFGFPLLLFLIIGFISCRQDEALDDTPDDVIDEETVKTKDFDNSVALDWMDLFLELERYTPGYRPPVSGRSAAYAGIAGYEAAVPGMKEEFNSMVGQFPGMEIPAVVEGAEYHWPTAVHAAYGAVVTQLFPTAPAAQQQKLFALKQKYTTRFSSEIPLDVFNRSDEFGTAVGNAVFKWSQGDPLGHEAFLKNTNPNYVPPVFEGSWKPTYPDYSPGLLPYWGQVRTFAASTDDNVPPPISYSTDPNSQLYVQAKETMTITNLVKSGQNSEDAWIADFWSDDCPILTFTPAGRWIAIANQIVEKEKVALDIAVYTYAKVGIALNDAGVRCWNEKYRYNLLRPIDYIHEVMGETSWNTVMCPDGSGSFYTPNFPAYPSGHGTFASASAEVLTEIFGFNYSMTDRCHEGRSEFKSTPRTYGSFYEMAAENAYSRIPLGVHFRIDAEAGLELGAKIGRKINKLPWRKKG
jgi:membrane-associated phospholipid phosphatase